MVELSLLVVLTILVALFFDFVNGFHDSANAIATVIATRVLTPVQAVLMAGFFNFVGPFVFSLAVANTVGKGIIRPEFVTTEVLLGALAGAIVWDLLTWWVGLPTSSSHALVGGLVGAGLAASGPASIFSPAWREFTQAGTLLVKGAIGGLVFGVVMLGWSRVRLPRPFLPILALAATAGTLFFGYAEVADVHHAIDALRDLAFGRVLIKPFLVTAVYALLGAVFGVFLWAATQQTMQWRTIFIFMLPAACATLAVATLLGNIQLGGFTKVLIFMIVSPILGFFAGFLMSSTLHWLWRNTHMGRVNTWSRRLQVGSSAFYALTHGTNDAQKTMGIIGVLLFTQGAIGLTSGGDLDLPVWVLVTSAAAMGLGTAFGGWRIVHTMAARITRLSPHQGFAAETGGGVVLVAMAESGIPVSTTHAISSSIMGVGATRRTSAVRWNVGRQMFVAWLLTIQASAVVAALSYWALIFVIGPLTP